jgi:DNA-binding CsgD family transcriptional regulator
VSPLDELTEIEREVLHWVAEGLTNREIAARRFTAERTVKFHIGHIFKKLGVRNRVEAAVTYHVWAV